MTKIGAFRQIARRTHLLALEIGADPTEPGRKTLSAYTEVMTGDPPDDA